MEGRRFDSMFNSPIHGVIEHGVVVIVHAEYETTVHHHAQIMQPADGGAVIATKVLKLPLLP